MIQTSDFKTFHMSIRLGLGTPPAFVITTEGYRNYLDNDNTITEGFIHEYTHHILELERQTGKVFGSKHGAFPLLLCCRVGIPILQQQVSSTIESEIHNWVQHRNEQEDSNSFDVFSVLGAPESWCCPGVMETIVSIGINEEIVEHLSHVTNRCK
jgi:phosphoenolpyruvate synthase/pyruvate phosphate dikinase